MLESLLSFFELYPWGVYACFFILPFIQEDAAVLGSAAAAVAGLGDPFGLGVAILAGLSFSDLWKYWAGRAALEHKWAKKYADKSSVKKARDNVVNHLAKSLMVVRFVPGTRIPFYVASGFFKAPFDKFAIFVVFSGLVYILLAFALFYIFGEVFGEQVHKYLPFIAMGLVVIVVGGQFLRVKLSPTSPLEEEIGHVQEDEKVLDNSQQQ